MYNIKLAREKDIPELIDFFRKVYRSGHIMTEKEYLRWQFNEAPANPCYPDYPNLILEKGKRVVGHLGLIPYEFRIHGKLLKAAFLACLIVEEELRSHGAGVRLVREAEKYFDILYTTGFLPPVAPIFKFCHWSEEVNMTRWVHECRKDYEFAEDPAVVSIDRFGEDWDVTWGRLRDNYAMTIDRSARYLNWRFIDNPQIRYQIFGGRESYIILRVEKGDEFTAGRIVDLIGDTEAVTRLLRRAVEFAVNIKADFVDFFSFPEVHREAFQRSGFYMYNHNVNPEPPIFILPADRKMLTLNFSYKCADSEVQIRPEDWFVVKADGDRDRAY